MPTLWGVWVLLLAPLASGALPCKFNSTEEALAVCDRDYTELYAAIAHDLRPWQQEGISLELMRRAAHSYSILGFQKGIVLGFQGGKAYVIAANVTGATGWLGHHANIMFTYMHVMLDLEQLFGSHIPDVEFVITTGDKPQVLKQERAQFMHAAMQAMQANNTEHNSSSMDAEPTPARAKARRLLQLRTTDERGGIGDARHRLRTADGFAAAMQQELLSSLHKRDIAVRSSTSSKSGMSRSRSRSRGSGMSRKRRAAAGSVGRRTLVTQQPLDRHVIAGPQAPIYLGTPPPVLRFCSSVGHADIRQPIFHFYTKKYAQRLLPLIPSINDKYPWDTRKEILFGRFSKYPRHVHPFVPETFRAGANGTNICTTHTKETLMCGVRNHMFQVAAQHPQLMDISSKGKVALPAHARYKYLVHVDGQGLSSRLDQLMPLGSLIFKEESGYTTYYHDLLKPYVHYIPFWKTDPQDVLEGLAWAKAHDAEAHKVALAAQAFAQRYLSKRARTCYWYKLISEFAKLLTYRPRSGGGALGMTWMPIREYFDKVAKHHEGGKRFRATIEQ